MNEIAQRVIDETQPVGYAINRGGPGGPGSSGGLDTKSKIWGILPDWHDPDCVLVVTRFLDNSPVLIRYHRRDVVLTSVHYTQLLNCDYVSTRRW